MKFVEMEHDVTIKELRKEMRKHNKEDELTRILIKGWGQIGCGANMGYSLGPLPENDDSDPMTDYSAWSYGWKESWVLERLEQTR